MVHSLIGIGVILILFFMSFGMATVVSSKTKKQENFYSAMAAICFISAVICFISAAVVHFYNAA